MINQYIQTYVKDKTKLSIYKNNSPVTPQSVLPYGIDILDYNPAGVITDLERFFVIKFLNLLNTTPGERIMFPDYGLDFQIFVFNNSPQSIVNGIKSQLTMKLKEYLPQVQIKDLSIINYNVESHYLSLNFSLLINPTNTIASVTYTT